MVNTDKIWERPWSWEREQDRFRQYLLQFSSKCYMYWSIELTVLLSFCVGVKFGVLHQEKNTDWGFVRAGGEGNIWCEREVGIEGCRRLCSELHVCYCSPDIINIIHNVACSMHIVKKKGTQSLLRKPEQEEPRWRLRRIMQMSVLERNMEGGLGFLG